MTQELRTTLVVNGRSVTRMAPGHCSLLRWLREAGHYDVKYGCGEGICGACTVLVNGSNEYREHDSAGYRSVSSCLVPAARFDGCRILTVSGLLENGALNDLQQAFLAYGAAQCGFCTPGMLLAATELLATGAILDREQIRDALHGNLCRCTGYEQIVSAVEAVSRSRVGKP